MIKSKTKKNMPEESARIIALGLLKTFLIPGMLIIFVGIFKKLWSNR